MSGPPGTALVLGGAGFVGSHLVRDLLKSGQSVVVFDNLSTGTLAHLQLDHPNLLFIVGDIVDTQSLRKVFADCRPQSVWHLAALHFIPYCNSHPTETIRVNVMGTQAVANCCLEFGVRELIYTSSAAVYPIADRASSEEDPPSPSDVYSITKLAGEMLISASNEGSEIRCIIARLFNVYGSGETNWHVIPEIVDQALTGNTVHLGNTRPKRDFIHVNDVVIALKSLDEARWIKSGIYNVGTGTEFSVAEVVECVAGILEKALTVQMDESRLREVDRLHLMADISKIHQDIGWEPSFTLDMGLAELLRSQADMTAGRTRVL